MAKGKQRKKVAANRATKRANKKAGINKPSGKSRYGQKHEQQARGNFSERSPFEAGRPEREVKAEPEAVEA